MSKIIINQNQFSDLLNIKYKVFYPLKTFVNKEQFLRILKKCQYEDKFFPFPVFFGLKKKRTLKNYVILLQVKNITLKIG